MPSVGPLEIAIVVVLALLVFGPRRLPELGSSLGRSIRGFGKGIKGEDEGEDAELPAAEEAPPPAAPAASKATGRP
ncbi:MAG: twin-arginine translocase TatA/TatE family subunit [Solirubrobacterales bacterium]